MAWPPFSFGKGQDKEAARLAREAARQRAEAWEQALKQDRVPPFVEERLKTVRAGQAPWTSTMTPAELLLAVRRGVRPIATISGTCWYHYGYSWTEGHAAGWVSAQYRLREEALLCGANAVVDVKMRTIPHDAGGSMDFTLVGTAIKLDGLPASPEPIIATVPLMSFVRLLQAGVTPVGLAVGAHHDWLIDQSKTYGGGWTWNNQPLGTLSQFWQSLRRRAHRELRADGLRQGNGVLAHTHLSQLIKQEGGDRLPDRYLGRHIVVGTAVQAGEASAFAQDIRTVVDMCDELSPLVAGPGDLDHIHGLNERAGAI